MANLNLVLKFRMAGETDYQIRAAGGIRLDGRGFMVYDAQTGREQKIETGALESLSITSIVQTHLSSPVAVAV